MLPAIKFCINAIGNQTILAQAIEAGNIDATLLDPFLSRRMKQKGLTVLVELQRAKIPFVNTSRMRPMANTSANIPTSWNMY